VLKEPIVRFATNLWRPGEDAIEFLACQQMELKEKLSDFSDRAVGGWPHRLILPGSRTNPVGI
jgi:hypothetical protein